MFRAYDKATGEVVAEIELPGKTSGAPMTYMHEGRQYIAVALAEQERAAELVVLALSEAGERPGEQASVTEAAEVRLAAAADVPAAPAADATHAADHALGRAVFAQNCALCHCDDGRGAPQSNAPALGAMTSLEDIRIMVANGAAEMPGMAAILSAEEIDAVVRYVADVFPNERGAPSMRGAEAQGG
jgi:quinoprotein glucose dehydrogenase